MQQAERQGPIDEVKALKDIFYNFFNANTQAQQKQKDVLVNMTTHETSINPFHVPTTTASNHPDNVVEGEYFPNLDLRVNSDKILMEKDSAEAPDDNDKAVKTTNIPADLIPRKSSLSGMSNSQRNFDNDDYEEDPKDQPWVDKIKPRLVPDWTDVFKSDQN